MDTWISQKYLCVADLNAKLPLDQLVHINDKIRRVIFEAHSEITVFLKITTNKVNLLSFPFYCQF